LGVTLREKLRVGLSVPAFFIPQKKRDKKELHYNPSRGFGLTYKFNFQKREGKFKNSNEITPSGLSKP
jgi:hypothetical protein